MKISKAIKAIICGDIIFFAKWDIFWSPGANEQEKKDLFEDRMLKNSVEFLTRGMNTLDVLLYHSCIVVSSRNDDINKVYYC